jgi:hypothetical protein
MADSPAVSKPNTARSERYSIRIPVIYRAMGAACWQEGWTENVSPAGMLLCVDETLEPGTVIDMAFTLALNRKAGNATRVKCTGKVVRIIRRESDSSLMFGIRILDFDLARMPETPQGSALKLDHQSNSLATFLSLICSAFAF